MSANPSEPHASCAHRTSSASERTYASHAPRAFFNALAGRSIRGKNINSMAALADDVLSWGLSMINVWRAILGEPQRDHGAPTCVPTGRSEIEFSLTRGPGAADRAGGRGETKTRKQDGGPGARPQNADRPSARGV